MPLGDKVRTARKKSGLTTLMLAKKAGISQSYISEIENNRKSPSTKTILKLADILQAPFDFLLRDDISEIDSTSCELFIHILSNNNHINIFRTSKIYADFIQNYGACSASNQNKVRQGHETQE